MTTTEHIHQNLDLEHERLLQSIRDWRAWWKELAEFGVPHFGEMGDRIRQLRETVAEHFRHEEQATAPLREAPQTKDEWNQLHAHHETLLQEFDELIDRLKACEPPFECWGKAREEMEAILDRLEKQEQAEMAIIHALETK